jgi:hypothetical protein
MEDERSASKCAGESGFFHYISAMMEQPVQVAVERTEPYLALSNWCAPTIGVA